MKRYTLLLIAFALSISHMNAKQTHPRTMLTLEGVQSIKKGLGQTPLFDQSLTSVKVDMDKLIKKPIEVPIPKDAGGGYTHERHKKNYNEMHQAGVLYQVYSDAKYALFVKNMLLEYAKMYPTLPLHPVQKSSYRGRLFWQGLNECVWLVHTAMAYDCIYDYLSADERKTIEQNLFYPMVKFISEENQSTFDKIHNHGTWAVTGVGMIGYVMNDKDLVEKALLGSDKSGKGGFLKQLNKLFSPDGYFEEGPYYQRYSMQPFIMFAQVIQNNEPERKIFEYRDGILVKAVNTCLQLAYTDGQLFHLNDALDKTWHSIELVYGVNVIYNQTKNADLLAVAKEQNQVILADAGYNVAKSLTENKVGTFTSKTIMLRDGADGKAGGVGILREGDAKDQTCVVMKYTSHGMSHGHYDKLSISYYDNNREIIQDYGAARFLNIEPKNGGHYLPENDSWAKQTIAHNTLSVDETSHFEGDINIAEKYSPSHYFFDNTPSVKMVSAKDSLAYPGIKMQRSIFLVNNELFEKPLVIDIFRINSVQAHNHDLPFYFLGHLISTNFEYDAKSTERHPLGTKNGYQHLWVEAETKLPLPGTTNMTWLNNNRFYTITTTTNKDTKVYLNRIGANDQNFNLRNETAFMLREKASNRTFVSTIEAHGLFEPRLEFTEGFKSSINEITTVVDNEEYSVVKVTTDKGTLTIAMSNKNSNPQAKHSVGGISWQGVYKVITQKK